jgi:hypothetical protein
MDTPINQLVFSIFNKPLSECTVSELRQVTQQFPWFGPAHAAYAKKLEQGNPSMYEEQVQKASLFFQNRLWLQYLLHDYKTNEATIPHAINSAIQSAEIIEPEETIQPEASITIPVIEEEKTDMDAGENSIEDPSELTTTDSVPAEALINEEPALEIPKLKIEPIDPNKSLLTFEPYHTVDYFASQGIKMKEEDRPKDRFTQQLKSFTEWLKVMKKVPASEMEKLPETVTQGEKKVEELAEHSLAERHIVTEAMAEVWTKQGNRQKAEEIYRKLSLLDPSKTAYFATKIEELKKLS